MIIIYKTNNEHRTVNKMNSIVMEMEGIIEWWIYFSLCCHSQISTKLWSNTKIQNIARYRRLLNLLSAQKISKTCVFHLVLSTTLRMCFFKMACLNVDEFRKIHNHQLKSIGFPNNLVQDLFNQLSNDDETLPAIKEAFEIKKSGNTSKLFSLYLQQKFII